jgi:hypothetical protein
VPKKAELNDATNFIKSYMETPTWVLVPRTISFKIRQQLGSVVTKGTNPVHPQFRLIICVDGEESLPATMVADSSIRALQQSNKVFKQNFVRTMSTIPAELLERNKNRTDWLPLLHNLCFVDRFVDPYCVIHLIFPQLSTHANGNQPALNQMELLGGDERAELCSRLWLQRQRVLFAIQLSALVHGSRVLRPDALPG